MTSQTDGSAARRRPPQWLADVAVTVFVVLSGAAPLGKGHEVVWSRDVVLLNLVVAAVLLARRRLPEPTVLALVALSVLSVPLGLFNPGLSAASAIATYSVTLRLPRRAGLITTLVVAVAMSATALLAGDTAPQHALAVLLGGAIGDAIRAQRAHLASITERAERAERTREAVARQRVAEDRLGIARDLHDVVAHQIAVINLHAGVASSALRERPDDAEASLSIIRQASRTVLAEIGDLLSTLRDPGAADSEPTGLAQLDDVVRDFATHGLDVTVRYDAPTGDLPRAIDVTALRVVQEGLTNAHKHGTGDRAHVLLETLPRTLRVTITNPVRPGASDPALGNRQGLIGMAERVESVRGTLRYGRLGAGTWELAAELPLGPAPTTVLAHKELT
ncbi:sensor histidine kinase [Cellulomonas biazotea]|jgi:signal transduction histidine kinase|uniref:histidine kinase n=1 Tax=Cellulomonas biazotea TaxID=1709 RepID=A0A402DMS9_9CELL|nr:histidine kinase [Cellulomonas biazotea]GCE75420.1 two-component sensor histidine kinase [Cellulomonas biazotea]